jgi:hypothetical protein
MSVHRLCADEMGLPLFVGPVIRTAMLNFAGTAFSVRAWTLSNVFGSSKVSVTRARIPEWVCVRATSLLIHRQAEILPYLYSYPSAIGLAYVPTFGANSCL